MSEPICCRDCGTSARRLTLDPEGRWLCETCWDRRHPLYEPRFTGDPTAPDAPQPCSAGCGRLTRHGVCPRCRRPLYQPQAETLPADRDVAALRAEVEALRGLLLRARVYLEGMALRNLPPIGLVDLLRHVDEATGSE